MANPALKVARSWLGEAERTLAPARGDHHGPFPPLLVVLTAVTGVVDAVSYLSLGHVFVANMTGNTVFIGFGLAGAAQLSIAASLVAIGAFLLGAAITGRATRQLGTDRGRLLTIATTAESILLATALVVALIAASTHSVRYPLIVLLAVAMSIQNTTARKLAVPDLTTTVLTLTITGLAADTAAGTGMAGRTGRRIVAVVTMVIGALVGGALALHVTVAAALALALALTASAALTCHLLSRSRPSWTKPPSS